MFPKWAPSLNTLLVSHLVKRAREAQAGNAGGLGGGAADSETGGQTWIWAEASP